jgi:alpha-1,6-mannosyltransferase
MKGIPIRFVILALLLETLFLLLRWAASDAERIVTAIVILLLAGAVFVSAAYFAYTLRTQDARPLFRFIIAAAIVYRITIWPLMFPSTDDAYRYRWEGKLQAHGGNPYEVRPTDANWASLRDSTYPRVGLKDFKGGYGPAWELISATTYRVVSRFVRDEFRQTFWFKVPAVLADLGVIAAIAALLRAYRMPEARVLVYAWSPLPIWEFWANGHNDAVAILAAVLAVLFAVRARPWRASAALAIATALKLWPLVLVPAIVRAGVRPHHLSIWAPILTLLALPYWTGVGENIRFMSGFVGGWRNNDSLFGVILWFLGDQYRAKYTAFVLIGSMSVLFAIRLRDTGRAGMWTIVALLLIASNCHPWYLTWFLPLLALNSSAGLLLWTAVVPMFYSVWPGWIATGIWDGVTPTRWLVYGPVFTLIAARAIYGRWTAERTRIA